MTKTGRRGRPRKPGSLPVDPSTIDPRAILAGIASDRNAPPTSRVSAAKTLAAMAEADLRRQPLLGTSEAEREAADDLNCRALKLLRGGRVS